MVPCFLGSPHPPHKTSCALYSDFCPSSPQEWHIPRLSLAFFFWAPSGDLGLRGKNKKRVLLRCLFPEKFRGSLKSQREQSLAWADTQEQLLERMRRESSTSTRALGTEWQKLGTEQPLNHRKMKQQLLSPLVRRIWPWWERAVGREGDEQGEHHPSWGTGEGTQAICAPWLGIWTSWKQGENAQESEERMNCAGLGSTGSLKSQPALSKPRVWGENLEILFKWSTHCQCPHLWCDISSWQKAHKAWAQPTIN